VLTELWFESFGPGSSTVDLHLLIASRVLYDETIRFRDALWHRVEGTR
jgi:hypothetical protein